MSIEAPLLRDLIGGAKAGDRAAQDVLLARYRDYLVLLARMSLSRGVQAKLDASDVVQDALVRAHRGLGEFRGATEEELVAWLRQILSRTLANADRLYRRTARPSDRTRAPDRSPRGRLLPGALAAPGRERHVAVARRRASRGRRARDRPAGAAQAGRPRGHHASQPRRVRVERRGRAHGARRRGRSRALGPRDPAISGRWSMAGDDGGPTPVADESGSPDARVTELVDEFLAAAVAGRPGRPRGVPRRPPRRRRPLARRLPRRRVRTACPAMELDAATSGGDDAPRRRRSATSGSSARSAAAAWGSSTRRSRSRSAAASR